MNKLFRIYLTLLLTTGTGMHGIAQAVRHINSDWQEFTVAAVKPDMFSAREMEGAYFMIAFRDGVKNNAIKESGIEIVRKLDPGHYIVRFSANMAAARSSPLIERLYTVNDRWKLAPGLAKMMDEEEEASYTLITRDMKKLRQELPEQIAVMEEHTASGALMIRCKPAVLKSAILPHTEVIFIGRTSIVPREESLLLDADLGVNKVNLLHDRYPALEGSTMTVSVKEQLYRTDDIDLRGRHKETGLSGKSVSGHSTDMATLIAGAGNSAAKSRGVAKRAWLASSDFNQLMPDRDAYFSVHDITVQNHSYGTSIENFYGAHAHGYDLHANRNPSVLHIFSAGNSGMQTDTVGVYRGVKGFANLTGNFKMAKNILTVGAVDTLLAADPYVSRGPAYDGRIKPELVTYSGGGSSNSAALLTGITVLLQESFKKQHGGALPPSALLRAVLFNSAADLESRGPDFFTGYGNVNAYKALQSLQQQQYFEGSVQQGEETTFTLTVPENIHELKLSLVWNDPAAEPNAYRALVNDLDLALEHKASAKSWQPWVLNPYPHADSLSLPARRGKDRLNNAEQISILKPEAGEYQLKISGYDVPEGPQQFYLVYQWEEEEQFQWTYPTGSDFMPQYGERSAIFRWETTYAAKQGVLEFSIDEGNSWQLIAKDVDLLKEFYQWQAPELFTHALARMRINDKEYVSDTFTISRPLRAAVGFNCSDSVMLRWDKLDDAAGYTIYSMGDQYLEEVAHSSDTFFIFQKSAVPQQLFSIAPQTAGQRAGIRNRAFDYSMQGVDCYIAYFVATGIDEEGVELNLRLGTNRGVEQVRFERKNRQDFKAVVAYEKPLSADIVHVDNAPFQGYNEYRAVIGFSNGEELITDISPVYFLSSRAFLVFPNPVTSRDELHIYTRNFQDEEVELLLYNSHGQQVLEYRLTTDREKVSLYGLIPGLYFYTLKGGGTKYHGRLIIQ